jgi:phosphoadenosine phosphosulfate reductase
MSDVSPRGVRAQRLLEWALEVYRGRIALACSFGGPSGMALLDLAVRIDRTVPVYFLDTGLLFAQTYALVERVRERYGIEPLAARPELSLAEQARAHGDALWSRDPDRCCALRKVAPNRALLRSYAAWISGIRRDQTSARAATRFVARDEQSGGLVKISPLADWNESDVWSYVTANEVPYNTLHDAGYPSLGCIPCTRAVRPGEDARSGRWSSFAKTECGLHAHDRASEEVLA